MKRREKEDMSHRSAVAHGSGKIVGILLIEMDEGGWVLEVGMGWWDERRVTG